jgi:hypothetical protein
MARYCPPFSYRVCRFPGSAAAAACARGSGGRFAGRGWGGRRERRGGEGRRRRAAGEKGCEGGGIEFTVSNQFPTALAEEVWLRGTRLRSQSQRAALGVQSLSRPLRPFPAFKRKVTLSPRGSFPAGHVLAGKVPAALQPSKTSPTAMAGVANGATNTIMPNDMK